MREFLQGTVGSARLLEENILALDVVTEKPFVYAPGQDAMLTVEIGGRLVQRRFSLAGSMEAETTRLARFLIRHNPDGSFTNWLFEQYDAGTLVGQAVSLAVVPMPD